MEYNQHQQHTLNTYNDFHGSGAPKLQFSLKNYLHAKFKLIIWKNISVMPIFWKTDEMLPYALKLAYVAPQKKRRIYHFLFF